MILLGNQTLPIGIPCKEIWWNSIFLCPITGEIWARIDRGRRTWSSETRPREGAAPAVSIYYLPGSLLMPGEPKQVLELPLPLLAREWRLHVAFAKLPNSGYTMGPNDEGSPVMSPELMNIIATLTHKIQNDPKSVSPEEYREGLRLLRQERMSVKAGTGGKTAKEASKAIDGDAELESMLS